MRVIPAAVIRPAPCVSAAWYQRDCTPLYARAYSPPSTATDQIHVGVPNVTPSGRRGAMCRSSAPAMAASSSAVHSVMGISSL